MPKIARWLFVLAFVGIAELTIAAERCSAVDNDRPSIGLVLGGGGARGSAHIGVLQVLEEMQVPVDYIVGTSMGSLVGALYATGMPANELESLIVEIDWDDMFKDQSNRQIQPFRRKRDDSLGLNGPKFGLGQRSSVISTGLVSGQKISFLFESVITERALTTDFDRLPIPYRAVAADLLTGDKVVIADGSLALAMRASMSVPGVFEPVEWGERLLVDGGIVDNVPIDVARAMGADIVIAVHVGGGVLERDQIKNALSVMTQLFNLMIAGNVKQQLATLSEQDILIIPPLGREFSSAAFDRSADGVQIGYQGADAIREELSALSLSDAQYSAHRANIESCTESLPQIQFVRVDNTSRFADEVILRKLNARAGEPLDIIQLEEDIKDIYALGFLGLARYEIVEEDGAAGIVVHVTEDNRGTSLVEWGLDVFGDGGDGAMNFRLGYLRTDIDELGSEFRVVGEVGRDLGVYAEMYKYLNPDLGWFVLPRIYARQLSFTEYIDGDAISTFDSQQYGGSVALGYELDRHAAISAGLNFFRGDAETVIGPPDRIDTEFDGGEFFTSYTYDRLDDRFLPLRGNLVKATYVVSDSSLGADVDYQQILFGGVTAHSFGRHTLWGGLRYLDTVNGDAPSYVQFFGGGFLRLSGFNDRELVGQSFGVLMGSYQYQLSQSRLLPGRAGFSVEYGQVADTMSDVFEDALFHGSVFIGYRTPVGPMYIGYGMGEGGRNRFFLRIGDVFGDSTISR